MGNNADRLLQEVDRLAQPIGQVTAFHVGRHDVEPMRVLVCEGLELTLRVGKTLRPRVLSLGP